MKWNRYFLRSDIKINILPIVWIIQDVIPDPLKSMLKLINIKLKHRNIGCLAHSKMPSGFILNPYIRVLPCNGFSGMFHYALWLYDIVTH